MFHSYQKPGFKSMKMVLFSKCRNIFFNRIRAIGHGQDTFG